MDGNVARRDTNADMNVLAAYSLLDEEEVEKSIIPKNWLKTANDSTLRYYLSILNQSAHRFRIEREMKFRR